MATVLFLLLVGGYGLGALVSLLLRSGGVARALTAAGAMLGSASGLALAIHVLATGAPFTLELPGLLSIAGGLALRLDALGAFFLAVVSLVALPAALYGAGYSDLYEARGSLPLLGVMLNLFLLTLSLVPLADNVLTFLAMWEGMSLTSYFLVMIESDEPGTLRAGVWYLGMTQFGLAFLLAAFLLLSGDGQTGFAELRAGASSLSPGIRGLVFVLALLGFGSKAGLVPLHVWLPLAHPAAPSHVSALMSGVMIKMGVYGLLRVGVDLLGGGPAWWGGLLLAVGAGSALLGVLYALMEHDLKRLLAYHSVENIGIIFIGLGAGLMFQSYRLPALAALGFVGGLYHTLNHACFKALLFLGAGSVLHATRSRNMEELGGLIKRMPRTAIFFLVGAAAISALPPLNGFVSEWLVFQALLGGAAIPRAEVGVLMPIAVAMLALTSGLAAACFVKAFGITFLGIPRSEAAAQAHEVPLSMQAAMALLALGCVAFGFGAFLMVPALGGVLSGLGGMPAAAVVFTLRLPLPVTGAFGTMSPSALLLGLVVLLGLVPLALRLAGASRASRVTETWGCGRITQSARMQYTATSFAEPLRRVFAQLYRPTEDLTIDFHPESRYFVQSIEYQTRILPWFERYLYEPVVGWVRGGAAYVRAVQSGSVHAYLSYLVAALVVLLGLLAVWGQP
ncbi:MAG TPA: hydrogenase 4 subunit B [Methylomirabilota bacterium]|jgi:hydrogenase-4 component B|nr:hydrogenase 4 subunit B [Methylomirabilota bacterium]